MKVLLINGSPKTKGNTDLNDYDYGMDDDEEYADFESYEEEEDK